MDLPAAQLNPGPVASCKQGFGSVPRLSFGHRECAWDLYIDFAFKPLVACGG